MAEIFRKTPGAWPGRGYLLYLLALPLVPGLAVSLYRGDTHGALGKLAGLVLIAGGGWLTRRGFSLQASERRRALRATAGVAERRLGALSAAAGCMLCSYLVLGNGLGFAALVGALVLLGCHLAYGDVSRQESSDLALPAGYSAEEVASMLDEAETKIRAIEEAAKGVRQRELSTRLRGVAGLAREVLQTIEDDPRDFRRARKFLNVYLDGAQRVAESYVRTHPDTRSDELETRFRNVLTTIEQVFAEQKLKLLEDDLLDLDVQIEVLSTQLKKEGVV